MGLERSCCCISARRALASRRQTRYKRGNLSSEREMSEPLRIGVLGDLHGFWDDWDARWFGASDHDLVLFTGDLGSGTGSNGVRIARSIGRLDKRALVMPGNNDVTALVDI